ncbi:MAG: proteasome accessory factor PafA2 [Actinomycetota bacterium]|nr:proteasome accessory factor PafA2 [Actinomycetota bacterium]
MAIRKVCGIETEYGIVLRGGVEPNPMASSSLLINAYVASLQRKVGWDFEDETPGNDARGYRVEGPAAPEVETHLVNAVLTNGARYYVDHAHPELSTPECVDAREVVVWDKAAERILVESMRAAGASLAPGQQVVVYKNNSDRKGNSYGCHENYLMDRAVPFPRIVAGVVPFLVTRQLFAGAGKVGSEAPGISSAEVPFQLSQRADFFEEEVGLETTLKRPIVNTRDEPHCDAQKYRRLHVILGDANCAEVSTFLKVGTTALVLAMIEDDELGRDLALASPVQALRRVSYDLGLSATLELAEGGCISALDLQWEYLTWARKYAESRGLEAVGEEVGAEVLRRWEAVLTALETDPMSLAGTLDWVAKYQLLSAYRERDGLGWDSARLAAMDLQYHDLRPERSLSARLDLERLTTDDEVASATTQPPRTTRAWFRGRCLQRWASQIVAANWDSMVFDVGSDPLRRVPMMEPLKGTAEMVDALLDECATPIELLRRLGAS